LSDIDLFDAVAIKTGEDISEICRRGSSLDDPADAGWRTELVNATSARSSTGGAGGLEKALFAAFGTALQGCGFAILRPAKTVVVFGSV